MSGVGMGRIGSDGAGPMNCGDLPRVGRSRGLVGILVCALVLSAAISIVASVGMQLRQQEERLIERYSPLADIAEDQIGGLRGEGWKALAVMKLRPLMQDRGVVYVSLVDSNGDEVLFLGKRSARVAGTDFTFSASKPRTMTRRVIGRRGESMTLRLGVVDAEAYGSLRTMVAAIGTGLIVSLLIGLGLLTRWQRRRSVGRRRLLEGLRRLMLDAPLKPLPVNGKGEEAYLARAFNHLSAQSVEQRRTIADLMKQLSVRTVAMENRGCLEIELRKQKESWLQTKLDAVCSLEVMVMAMTGDGIRESVEACLQATGIHARDHDSIRNSVDLRDAIHELNPFLTARAEAEGLAYEAVIDWNIPHVYLAREVLQLALVLSCSRAIAAADESHMTLSTRVVGSVVEISFGPCGLRSERLMQGDEVVCGLAASWYGAEYYEERSGRIVLTVPIDQTEALVGCALARTEADKAVWVAMVRLPRDIDVLAIYKNISRIAGPYSFVRVSDNQQTIVVANTSGERVLSTDAISAHLRSGIETVLPVGHGVTIDTILCSIQQAESCILNALRSEHQGLVSEAA